MIQLLLIFIFFTIIQFILQLMIKKKWGGRRR